MRKLYAPAILVLFFSACRKDEPSNYINATVNGENKSSKTLSVETIPGSNEPAFFSAAFGDGSSIGFRLNSQTAYDTGSYYFRQAGYQPATLVSFTIQVVNFKPQLKWITGQETGLQSFNVERSTDGTNFQNIGSVGATNTSTSQTYIFSDESVNTLSRFYYRLRLVDSNGQFSFSSVILYNGEVDYTAYLGQGNEKLKGYNGILQITEHDRSRRIISGFFSFDVKNNSQQVIQVRNGSFRFNY